MPKHLLPKIRAYLLHFESSASFLLAGRLARSPVVVDQRARGLLEGERRLFLLSPSPKGHRQMLFQATTTHRTTLRCFHSIQKSDEK